MIEAGAPNTEEATLVHREGARPTGGSRGRTARGPAHRGEDAKRKPGPSRTPAPEDGTGVLLALGILERLP
jgi:hypothetical protein